MFRLSSLVSYFSFVGKSESFHFASLHPGNLLRKSKNYDPDAVKRF